LLFVFCTYSLFGCKISVFFFRRLHLIIVSGQWMKTTANMQVSAVAKINVIIYVIVLRLPFIKCCNDESFHRVKIGWKFLF